MQEYSSEKRHGFQFSLSGYIDRYMVALAAINVLAIFLVYLPFLNDLTIIMRYWDGPLYMYVAKTLYMVPQYTPFSAIGLPDYYYACHLALFPLLIRAFSFIGYDWSMIFVVIASSTVATLLFYRLLKDFGYSKTPFIASILFIFFPARWLLYHSIGATEPLFIMLVIASLYCYKKDWYIPAFLIAGLASVTRIFGILMLVSYILLLLYEKKYRYLPFTIIIPIFLIGNFLVYAYAFGDALAYFKWNGGYMNAMPFRPLIDASFKGITNNVELYFGFYILFILGTLRLWKKPELFFFSAVFLGFMLFVFHPDISRYLLPVAPFALIIAFDDIISRKEFILIMPLIILFGYIYCWGILPSNLAPPELYSEVLKAIGT
jgi:hypothetical protein